MDYSEKWGVDVEEAVKLALIDLKLSEDEVEVTVLEEPSKGFFGIGSKLAKVRVEKKKSQDMDEEETPKEDVKEEAEKVDTADTKEHRERRKTEQKEHKERAWTATMVPVKKEKLTKVEEHDALTFLRDLTEKMGLSVNIDVMTGGNVAYVEISGKDSGTVIGKRGQTLDSIQYLTSLVVNKATEKYVRVIVDAENYRAKRQKTLEQLANRLASKVIRTKRYVKLEPMNPYERKVIHATLQKNPDVITRSEGDEPYRRVIIELKK